MGLLEIGIQEHKRLLVPETNLPFSALLCCAFIFFGISTFLSLSTLHVVFLVFADLVIQDIQNCFLSLLSWEVLWGETAELCTFLSDSVG